jgi:hypothetical protein
MKDLRTKLREVDPLTREGGLSSDQVARMRRLVLSATPELPSSHRRVHLAIAATLLLTTVGGVLLTRASLPESAQKSATTTATGVMDAQPLRQLQFSAPGGTRVIWTFNPNLEVR